MSDAEKILIHTYHLQVFGHRKIEVDHHHHIAEDREVPQCGIGQSYSLIDQDLHNDDTHLREMIERDLHLEDVPDHLTVRVAEHQTQIGTEIIRQLYDNLLEEIESILLPGRDLIEHAHLPEDQPHLLEIITDRDQEHHPEEMTVDQTMRTKPGEDVHPLQEHQVQLLPTLLEFHPLPFMQIERV